MMEMSAYNDQLNSSWEHSIESSQCQVPVNSKMCRSWLSLRSGRSLKGLCLLIFSIAFSIGVGIGLLVSIYFLPLTSESNTRSNQRISRDLISSKLSIPNKISNNFRKSYHIQSYQHSNEKYEVEGSTKPSRPNPNVQFIPLVNNSRLLAFHQTEFPAPKPPTTSFNFINPDSIVDGIYWSSQIEQKLPLGFNSDQFENWTKFVNNSIVMKMDVGCGRMQNRLLTLSNNQKACARYRQNTDQIQGEIFSFYLSELLGLSNLVPSALNLIQSSTTQWISVRSSLNLAQWIDNKPIVLTQFISNLVPTNIPLIFHDTKKQRLYPNEILNSNLSDLNLIELPQWSDLIIFDYLTGNLDRIVNNLYNLQWNPAMMDSPAHNLAKDPQTGLLIFLDNESGLLHGYRLLDKYEMYHRLMLNSVCIFRQSTVTAIRKLGRDRNVGSRLRQLYNKSNLVDYLPMLPEKSVKILNRRIQTVHDHIAKCESLYSKT